MKHLLVFPAVLLCALPAAAGDDKISWEKADAALQRSAETGKPVVWYFVVNEFSKDGLPPPVATIDAADKAFQNPVIIKKREPFLWVRGDQVRATALKVQGAPAIVVTDADGDVILRAPIASPENLYDAMQVVLKEKFVDVPVAWGDVVRSGPIKKKLLILGFEGVKGDDLKSLEDKTLVKYHKSCEFVKLPYEKGGDVAKRFKVEKAPTIVICDASEKVLERVSGKLHPCNIKVAIQRAMLKLEKR